VAPAKVKVAVDESIADQALRGSDICGLAASDIPIASE
jgi:hypothetical protein